LQKTLIRDIRNASVGKERIIEITKASKNLFQKLCQEHIRDEILKIWQLKKENFVNT